ncbi:MAG TPA: helix-turn-helix domain-containing protein, partial [Acidimicrobiales bacterium]
ARNPEGVEYDIFLADCPARTTLELVAHRWSVVVLHGLGETPMRFGQLQARIGGISPKSLAETLHRLEENGLVDREDGRWVLTDLGRSLLGPVRALARWAEEHTDALLAARDRRAGATTAPATAATTATRPV